MLGNMQFSIRKALQIWGVVILSGCSPGPVVQQPKPMDATMVALAEAADSIDNKAVQLHALRLEQTPFHTHLPADDPTQYGMGQLANVDWSGPVELLLRAVAAEINYRFKVIGEKPTLPVLVSVFKENTMVGDIVRTARVQAGERADVVVYPKERLIELRYARG